MNKFLRILSLIFLSLVLLGSFAVVVVRFINGGEELDDFDIVMITMCGVTALLALGSFLYHLRRLGKKYRSKKADGIETLLDDHLIGKVVQKQRLPLILRLANILYGLLAAIIFIICLNEVFSPLGQDPWSQVFLSIFMVVFGYSFIYNIVGSLAHFIKHG